MPEQIRVVGCFIPNAERDLLVVHRNTPTRQWWELIGGLCLPSERPAYAAERKAEQEAGISVRALKRIYSYEFPHNGKEYAQEVWWTKPEGGQPFARDEAHDDIAWMGVRTLNQRNDLSPGLQKLVQLAIDVPELFSI